MLWFVQFKSRQIDTCETCRWAVTGLVSGRHVSCRRCSRWSPHLSFDGRRDWKQAHHC